MTSEPIRCACPGAPFMRGEAQCQGFASQEDFLCDHCREIDCPTVTSWEISQQRMLAQTQRISLEMRR